MTTTFITEIFAILTLLFSFTGAVIVATVLYIKKYIDKHDLFIATLYVMTLESMAIVFFILMALTRHEVCLNVRGYIDYYYRS